MVNKSTKQLFSNHRRKFWRNLEVNIDNICDNWDDVYKVDFFSFLDNYDLRSLGLLLNSRNINIKYGSKQDVISYFKSNKVDVIEAFCIYQFINLNPKFFSQKFGIQIYKGKINWGKLYLAIADTFNKKQQDKLFIDLKKNKLGASPYSYKIDIGELKKLKKREFTAKLKNLLSYLRRRDIKHRRYYLRAINFSEKRWDFLILKEQSDIIYPAIENNIRVVKGKYIVFTVDFSNQSLILYNINSTKEASIIRYYLADRLTMSLSRNVRFSDYDSKKFFSTIVNSKNNKIKVIQVDFRDSSINTSISIKDINSKNSIIEQLKFLEGEGIIDSEKLSFIKSMKFEFKGIQFTVSVLKGNLDSYLLKLQDRGKPSNERVEFEGEFESLYNIPLNKFLIEVGSRNNKPWIYRKVLGSSTLQLPMFKELEETYIDLLNLRLINRPQDSVKRKCVSCYKATWVFGDCPNCGHELRIQGNYVDITLNRQSLRKTVSELISGSGYKCKLFSKQINKIKYEIIEAVDDRGNLYSFFLSHGLPDSNLLENFKQTGLPLVVIPVRFHEALKDDLLKLDFGCIDLANIIANRSDKKNIKSIIDTQISNLKEKWNKRIKTKGLESYKRLVNKPDKYTPSMFEVDVFNILHDIFLVGDRLGDKYIGTRAPDGIISIRKYHVSSKYCMAWDCKYSVADNGYNLTDSNKKHRSYINSLKTHEKVLLFGGLSSYLIISQNMNYNAYSKFYKQLTYKYRWKGKVLFIKEEHLLTIYKFYKDNRSKIWSSAREFYDKVYWYFKDSYKSDSLLFPELGTNRTNFLIEKLEEIYNKVEDEIKLDRDDFEK